MDGPEYSPDGKYIYYNANPTGTMQIWRMKSGGTEREQLTYDERHNWFPHISPSNVEFNAYIRRRTKSNCLLIWRTGNDECELMVTG